MKQLLFGTNNPHKLREIREILSGTHEVLSLRDIDKEMDVEETEPDLAGNALLKAKTYFEHTGIPCFADDTGLEVTALGGAPGVYTARYAGPKCLPEDNIRKLLAELKGKEERSACFRTVIAFYDGKSSHFFEGKVEGNITMEKQGEKGFGYDPVFLPKGYEQTFAELDANRKHAISHRGKAVRKFVDFMLNPS